MSKHVNALQYVVTVSVLWCLSLLSEFFSPVSDDLELWLTFEDDSLVANTSDVSYPSVLTRPTSPAYVLDRSPHNRHATVTGIANFDVLEEANGATMSGTLALSLSEFVVGVEGAFVSTHWTLRNSPVGCQHLVSSSTGKSWLCL